jgi:hypothetical protein
MLRAGRQEILRRSASDSNTTRTHHEGFPLGMGFCRSAFDARSSSCHTCSVGQRRRRRFRGLLMDSRFALLLVSRVLPNAMLSDSV